MVLGKIAISTMTLEEESNNDLLLESLSVLSKYPYDVYIADGGSSQEFLTSLERMGCKVRSVKGGLTFQHKYSIMGASSNSDVVLYTEPDKLDWFNGGLEESIEGYKSHDSDLGVIARTQQQISTFPEFQQKTECCMNELIGRKIGIKGDFIYGPKIFVSSLGKEINGIDYDIGWGGLMFLVGRAHCNNLKISTLETAVDCPLEQREETNERYRLKQLCENYMGFLLGLKK